MERSFAFVFVLNYIINKVLIIQDHRIFVTRLLRVADRRLWNGHSRSPALVLEEKVCCWG